MDSYLDVNPNAPGECVKFGVLMVVGVVVRQQRHGEENWFTTITS